MDVVIGGDAGGALGAIAEVKGAIAGLTGKTVTVEVIVVGGKGLGDLAGNLGAAQEAAGRGVHVDVGDGGGARRMGDDLHNMAKEAREAGRAMEQAGGRGMDSSGAARAAESARGMSRAIESAGQSMQALNAGSGAMGAIGAGAASSAAQMRELGGSTRAIGSGMREIESATGGMRAIEAGASSASSGMHDLEAGASGAGTGMRAIESGASRGAIELHQMADGSYAASAGMGGFAGAARGADSAAGSAYQTINATGRVMGEAGAAGASAARGMEDVGAGASEAEDAVDSVGGTFSRAAKAAKDTTPQLSTLGKELGGAGKAAMYSTAAMGAVGAATAAVGFGASFEEMKKVPSLMNAANQATAQFGKGMESVKGQVSSGAMGAVHDLGGSLKSMGKEFGSIGAANMTGGLQDLNQLAGTTTAAMTKLAPAVAPAGRALTDLAGAVIGGVGNAAPAITALSQTTSNASPGIGQLTTGLGKIGGAFAQGAVGVAGKLGGPVNSLADWLQSAGQTANDNFDNDTGTTRDSAGNVTGVGDRSAAGVANRAATKASWPGGSLAQDPSTGLYPNAPIANAPGYKSGDVDPKLAAMGSSSSPIAGGGQQVPGAPLRMTGSGSSARISGPRTTDPMSGQPAAPERHVGSSGGLPGGSAGAQLQGLMGGGVQTGASVAGMNALKASTDGAAASAQKLGSQAPAAMGQVGSAGQQAGQNVQHGLTQPMQQAPAAMSAAAAQIPRAVASAVPASSMSAPVHTAVQTATQSAAPAAASGGADLGAAIPSGMAGGASKTETEVVTVVKRLVEHVIDEAAGALGIASPSKVFYGFGVNVAEGLAGGMADSVKTPLSAAQAMVGSTIAGGQAAMGGSPLGGGIAPPSAGGSYSTPGNVGTPGGYSGNIGGPDSSGVPNKAPGYIENSPPYSAAMSRDAHGNPNWTPDTPANVMGARQISNGAATFSKEHGIGGSLLTDPNLSGFPQGAPFPNKPSSGVGPNGQPSDGGAKATQDHLDAIRGQRDSNWARISDQHNINHDAAADLARYGNQNMALPPGMTTQQARANDLMTNAPGLSWSQHQLQMNAAGTDDPDKQKTALGQRWGPGNQLQTPPGAPTPKPSSSMPRPGAGYDGPAGFQPQVNASAFRQQHQQVGAAGAAGLQQGLQGGQKGVNQASTNLAAGSLGAIKKHYQIASPSQAASALGSQVTAGVQQGIGNAMSGGAIQGIASNAGLQVGYVYGENIETGAMSVLKTADYTSNAIPQISSALATAALGAAAELGLGAGADVYQSQASAVTIPQSSGSVTPTLNLTTHVTIGNETMYDVATTVVSATMTNLASAITRQGNS